MVLITGASAQREYQELDGLDALREIKRLEYERDFYKFFKAGWKHIDPSTFVGGAPLQAVAEHLEAVADGQIKRLIINIPPRMSKSSMTSVAFPAWVWTQRNESPTSGAGVQFLHASYAQTLSLRDSVKCRRLISSDWYQKYWGDRFVLMGDQNTKTRFDNTRSGSRLSTSVGSTLTGEGGNIIVVDDPNAAQEAFSEATIQTTIDWWDTALSTRLNDPKSGAFIVIQQRLAEDDLTGHILSKDVGDWTHLMLPMKYEWRRHSVTSIGWEDWRGLDEDGNSLVYIMADGERIPINEKARLILENEREGSLLMPDRFGEKEVKSLEAALGPFAAAGQLQQTPQIKGGGIIKRDWWQPWGETFPGFDYIVASLDTAYTTKEENDMSALSIWGVFTEDSIAQATKALSPDGRMYSVDRMVSKLSPKVMLINAWQGRMEINDLVVKVATMCKASQVDMLMIENKASGISVSQEMRRLYSNENFSVQLHDPKSIDKMSRLYAVQHLFAEGLIYAPNRSWADMVINECAIFPKGKHDDIVDTVSQALNYLRQTGILQRPEEIQNDVEADLRHTSMKAAPLYNA